MKILVYSAFLFVCVGTSAVAKEHNWAIGSVVDANATREIRQTGTTSTSSSTGSATANTHGTLYRNGDETSTIDAETNVSAQSTSFGSTRVHHTVIQDNQVVIRGKDYVYTVDDQTLKPAGMPTHGIVGRPIANRKHGCRFIIGDDMKYEQDRNRLNILDADGKECKVDILRQERVDGDQVGQGQPL